MGGTDDESNIIELSVSAHAHAHKTLYEQLGHWQDYVAWQGLAKLAPKEDLIKRVQSEGGKKCRQLHPNPFAGIRIGGNFAINEPHRKRVSQIENSEAAREKRKKTFADIKHQQKENNSQYGKVWCVEEDAIDLTTRKKYTKELIPPGWIPTIEWSARKKNKNSGAYGRHWYNDTRKNYYVKPNDAIIALLSLQRGRLTK